MALLYRPRLVQAKAVPPLTVVPVAGALLSGCLYFLAFPPFSLSPLAWVALVPLLWALQERRPRHAFLLGYLAGAPAFAGLLLWMLRFGIVAWIALWGVLAVSFGAFSALFSWLGSRRSAFWRLWLVPIAWTAVEYLRSIGPLGFPWGLLGLSQSPFPPALQVASLAGVYGVSFLIALLNSLVFFLFSFLWEGGSLRHAVSLVVPAVAILLAFAYGFDTLRGDPAGSSPSQVTVAALQPNVPPLRKGDVQFAPEAMGILEELTREAAGKGASLIVFPESAVPGDLFGAQGRLPLVQSWARRTRATILASSYEGGSSNLAVAIGPDGSVLGQYSKMRLVAFAEAQTRPGRDQVVLPTPVGNVGVLICFESIFPGMARALVLKGAELLVVITNDGWFGESAGPAQHAQAAVLRAVETGRGVIRAANTGISMLVDPYGRVLAQKPVNTLGALTGSVPRRDRSTPYARWGDLFALSLLAIVGIVALPGVARFLGEAAGEEGFWVSLKALVLPGAIYVALRETAPSFGAVGNWLWPLLVLGGTRLASWTRLRPRGIPRGDLWGKGIGGWKGFGTSVTLGLGIVVGLAYVLYSGYAEWLVPITPVPPPDGWVVGGIRFLLAGIALETWLRGVAFEAVALWQTRRVAWALTTLVGVLVQAGLPAEAWIWALLTGASFGFVRVLSGNALGLGIARGVGDLLLWFLLSPR
jgi:apolipoprotein N-acyltransferase